jgi:hypothetical protein
MNKISAAANTVVPAILLLEKLGFTLTVEKSDEREQVRATRGEEVYLADDPVAVLGLVKLVEGRGWDWQPLDAEIQSTLKRHAIG